MCLANGFGGGVRSYSVIQVSERDKSSAESAVLRLTRRVLATTVDDFLGVVAVAADPPGFGLREGLDVELSHLTHQVAASRTGLVLVGNSVEHEQASNRDKKCSGAGKIDTTFCCAGVGGTVAVAVGVRSRFGHCSCACGGRQADRVYGGGSADYQAPSGGVAVPKGRW